MSTRLRMTYPKSVRNQVLLLFNEQASGAGYKVFIFFIFKPLYLFSLYLFYAIVQLNISKKESLCLIASVVGKAQGQ